MRRTAWSRCSSVLVVLTAAGGVATGCGGNDGTGIGFGGHAGASQVDGSADARGGTGGTSGDASDGKADGSADASGGKGGASGASGGGSGGASGSGGTADGSADAGGTGGAAGASGTAGASGAPGVEGGLDVGFDGTGGASGSGGGAGASGAAGGDASSDPSSDVTDARGFDVRGDTPCPVDNVACSNGGANGLCKTGACAACVEGPAPGGDDANCSTAYGGTRLCLGGACTPGDCRTNTDCALNAAGPLCSVTQPNFCGKCTTDAQCLALGSTTPVCNVTTGACVASTASCLGQADNQACTINSADVCCGSVCSVGDCCPGSAGDQLCQSKLSNNGAICSAGHQCTTCDPVAALTFLVDPVGGNDGSATGSGTHGGQPSAGCAFKTITRALQAIGQSPAAGTVVQVKNTGPVSAGSNGETFPINVTTNVTITATGGTVIVTPPASQSAFVLAATGSKIDGSLGGGALVIDGGAHLAYYGVGVTTGSTVATTLQNVTIQAFMREGIRVTGSGVLTVGPGVTVTQNGTPSARRSGLLVMGTGRVNVTVPSGQATTAFNDNTQHGIQVEGSGSVTIAASRTGVTSTVECRANGSAGLAIGQTPGLSVPANTIDGLVSFGSTLGNGIRIEGGSNVKMRNSASLGNAGSGVIVTTSVVGGNRNNVLLNIDLGKASEPGGNVFQTTGQNTNGAAGICLQVDQNSGTLSARGNLFSGGKDCGTTAASLTFDNASCVASPDLGLAASGGGATTGNDIDVLMCTHP